MLIYIVFSIFGILNISQMYQFLQSSKLIICLQEFEIFFTNLTITSTLSLSPLKKCVCLAGQRHWLSLHQTDCCSLVLFIIGHWRLLLVQHHQAGSPGASRMQEINLSSLFGAKHLSLMLIFHKTLEITFICLFVKRQFPISNTAGVCTLFFQLHRRDQEYLFGN